MIYVRKQIKNGTNAINKKRDLFKLWIKTVWRMRSVYSSFLVHIFDVFTDLLIIFEWLQLEPNKNEIDHLNFQYHTV